MPRLPDASQLDRAIPRGPRGVVTDRSAEILGDTLQTLSANKQAADDRFAMSTARNDVLSADVAARRELENDNDWQTYEQRYRTSLEGAIGKAAGTIQSPKDRALFEQEARLDLDRGAVSVAGAARRREVDTGLSTLSQTLTQSREQALTAQDSDLRTRYVQNVVDALAGAKEKGYITADQETEERQKWVTDYADGYVDTLSPEEAVRHLGKDGPADSPVRYLPADRRAVRLKQAQREVDAANREKEIEARSRLTEARQAMSDRLRDMQVAASLGMPVDVPPKATMLALYGDQEGAQRFQTAQRLAALSSDVAGLQQLPTHELIAKVESYRPTQVEGAAEQAQMQGALAGSVRQIIEQRAKDPAGYLTQQSPVVRKAWEDLGRDPSKAPQYLAAVRSEKERLGIPGHEVLPDGYVAAVADEISGTSAEKVADRIEQESQRWGKDWPQVYSQLAGKLPDVAAVIGSGIPRSAATALAATANLKGKELEAMLPTSIKPKDVTDAIGGQFEDFVRSMPPEAARTVNATLDAAMRLAIKYQADGASMGTAVKKAYRDLVGSQYELRPFRGAMMRVPAGASADAIERGASETLQHFEVGLSDVEVPQGAVLSSMEYAERLKASIRSRGYWLTNPGSTGLRLYLDGQPVDKGGQPFEVNWADLATSGNTVKYPSSQRRPMPN